MKCFFFISLIKIFIRTFKEKGNEFTENVVRQAETTHLLLLALVGTFHVCQNISYIVYLLICHYVSIYAENTIYNSVIIRLSLT